MSESGNRPSPTAPQQPPPRYVRDSHCGTCGAPYTGLPSADAWPRTCTHCKTTAYRNPLLVAVALLPSFGLQLDGRWPLALPVLVLGITAFLALGVIVGSYAKTPEAVAAVANCLMIPMAFLSGSFFPLDAMPGWMQALSRILPLRYFNDGVSGALTGGGSLAGIGVACAVLAGFALVLGAVALKTFRWSDKS
ncbi:hypothetical protein B5180_17835 [Streptomyces sp. BF-3]|nr:hypothetical protein B5180_17835 [Streptomyces sp. BF-3]